MSRDDTIDDAQRARDLMSRMWDRYQQRVDAAGYELVLLAVPKTPGNVEAVANRDAGTLLGMMKAFISNVEQQHELQQVEPADASPTEPHQGSTAEAEAERKAVYEREVGKSLERGGKPEGPGDAPAAQGQGNATASPLDGLTDKQINELHDHIFGANGFPGLNGWLQRERRINAAVSTGVPCQPVERAQVGQVCEVCHLGPCTGMVPRSDVG